MNRLRNTKGYMSNRRKPIRASVLTRIQTAMMQVCPMIKTHEPIKAATRSAIRSPALCVCKCVSCQFLILSLPPGNDERSPARGDALWADLRLDRDGQL